MRLTIFFLLIFSIQAMAQERGRIRDYGIEPGILTPGKWNAITDVAGVEVGHTTLVEGDNIRTGVTVIKPHGGNVFQQKVPAAVYVGNGFGKAIGFTQIEELGNIESPIALTNTLNSFLVADALVQYSLDQQGNENVRSVNPVVGETNDGWLNDIRNRNIKAEHVIEALDIADAGPVEEGSVGAGTGTLALGFKGGIGTSSRVLPADKGGYTVGVLVQSNFGGILTINGAPVGEELGNHYLAGQVPYTVDGSCMIIIATDAPLSARNLKRLAKRSYLAFAKVGGFSSNGSGDYSVAFSTHEELRVQYRYESSVEMKPDLNNDEMTPLFLAVVEATEEAILNSLFKAQTTTGQNGRTKEALPIEKTLEILDKYNARKILK